MGLWYAKVQTRNVKEEWIMIPLHVNGEELGPLDTVFLVSDSFFICTIIKVFILIHKFGEMY